MALKTIIQFPIFAPQNPSHNHRPITEIRFSRWNNANADKFNHPKRAIKEIEDNIRRKKRFDSASKIATIYENATATATAAAAVDTFKSIGTPSAPSRPSIPGKSSKYSKNPNSNPNLKSSHPAFRRISRVSKLPDKAAETVSTISIGEKGVSYVLPGAPFELQYSYTETPKVKPIALREPAFVPFGPSTMPRPWTGRAPLPPSKKKLPEFDSFRLPPPHKKGVKPVQAPGPFLAGSGPKYVHSREEILGEPLTDEEVKELVQSCLKSKRQLNMGRDGLTHNMLDNIHAHWKRRRVCKIKCKGVCTVDMDNVRQQLEEKTGGKIIYSRGGALFLFRGRNYNYRTRPRLPLMLWKPVTPVYPRLIQRIPEGLTLEEATEMRTKGRRLIPICKLGKNGVYSDIVNNVREAFEACELVRINCEGMNGSDYRKIGAKLKDLVPCVLISFEHEHILMWRGRDWQSSLINPEVDLEEAAEESRSNETSSIFSPIETHEQSTSCGPNITDTNVSADTAMARKTLVGTEHVSIAGSEDLSLHKNAKPFEATERTEDEAKPFAATDEVPSMRRNTNGSESILVEDTGLIDGEPEVVTKTHGSKPFSEGVVLLLKQAIDNGSAVILDYADLDADMVYEKAKALAQSAPRGPVFRHQPRKVLVQKPQKQEGSEVDEEEVVVEVSEKRGSEKKNSRNQRMNDFKEEYLNVVPRGSLRVDELAKLLA